MGRVEMAVVVEVVVVVVMMEESMIMEGKTDKRYNFYTSLTKSPSG